MPNNQGHSQEGGGTQGSICQQCLCPREEGGGNYTGQHLIASSAFAPEREGVGPQQHLSAMPFPLIGRGWGCTGWHLQAMHLCPDWPRRAMDGCVWYNFIASENWEVQTGLGCYLLLSSMF